MLAGLLCLASACSSNNSMPSGTGGHPSGSGGVAAGTGGSGAGGTVGGTGGSGTGGSAPGVGGGPGTTDSGVDAPAGTDAKVDSGSTPDIVVRDGSVTAGGAYVRTGWTAVAMPDHVPTAQTNPPTTEPLVTSAAFDGMNNTRWATGVFQDTLTFPLFFTVNMQQVLRFSRITLYAGSQDTGDYPVQLDVLVSTDGTNYTTAVSAHRPAPPANGANAGIDTINLTTPAIAQWIQLKATMGQPNTNRRWWAIGEMNVFP